MRILQITNSEALDSVGTNVATICNELFQEGHQVTFVVAKKVLEHSKVIELKAVNKDWEKELKKFALPNKEHENTTDDYLYSSKLLNLLKEGLLEKFDVIHLHSIKGGYFSFFALPFLATKPLIWTIYENDVFDTEACENSQIQFKKELLQTINLTFTVTTMGVKSLLQSKANFSKQNQIEIIEPFIRKYELNQEQKMQIRQKLGISKKSKVILFVQDFSCKKNLFTIEFLTNVLQNIQLKQGVFLTLMTIGSENFVNKGLLLKQWQWEEIKTPQMLDTLFALADLYLDFSLEDCAGVNIYRSLKMGIPVLANARPVAIEFIKTENKGSVLENINEVLLTEKINKYLNLKNDSSIGLQEECFVSEKIEKLINLYQIEINKKNPELEIKPFEITDGKNKRSNITMKNFDDICQKYEIGQLFDFKKQNDIKEFFKHFETKVKDMAKNPQKSLFINAALTYVIIRKEVAISVFFEVLRIWLREHQNLHRCGHLSGKERVLVLFFQKIVRNIFILFFQKKTLKDIAALKPLDQSLLILLWRRVFLNVFSVIVLDDMLEEIEIKNTKDELAFLLQTLYVPMPKKNKIRLKNLISLDRYPILFNVLLTFWVTNAPYYNANEEDRKRVLGEISFFCKEMLKPGRAINKAFFTGTVEHFMSSLWRIAYVKGNNVKALSIFGDYLKNMMQRFYGELLLIKEKPSENKKGSKIRIGYASANLKNQAVSFYMANRILHYDSEKFEVHLFFLVETDDAMSRELKQKSTSFVQFKMEDSIDEMIKAIKEKQLDILIYPDIGMDSLTYRLGALQLAPLQCVMVGHGTTTGLSTIQYYISGDFEPYDAQKHYREKLIKLPNLGAAQLPPPYKVIEEAVQKMTRYDFGLPEEAVVFVSFANGIKHRVERDWIFVEILKRNPNAVIVLKPFQHHNAVDIALVKRWTDLAKKEDLEKRLIIQPPFRKASMILKFLSLCDVQIDTFPYGGWTTNMEAMYVGLPIVTQEGDMMRNRWGAAMLRALGIKEGIAKNEEEYIYWATQYAQSSELRLKNKAIMQEKARTQFFDGKNAQKDFEDFLISIYNEKNKKSSKSQNTDKKIKKFKS